MSIAKLRLVPQEPRAATLTHAPDTLDFTKSLIVNREQLTEAHADARFVSQQLHNIESLTDLDWSELAYLCRTIYHAAEVLGDMLGVKGEAA